MDVYAVEQRAGNAVHIFCDGSGGARAAAGRMPVIAAGTRIHRCHKHERRRILHRVFGAGDSDNAVLDRLPEHFQHRPREFGKFIEEEDTVVCKRNLARHGIDAAADEGDGRHGMMRRAERASGHEHVAALQASRHGMDFCGFKSFSHAERGQNGGKAFRHH